MTASIAAILACYNRKDKTLACLRSLHGRSHCADARLSVYLLDDASSDETADAVKQEFPQVRLLKGDGNYFWNGGMRAAFGAAIEVGHDFYLWLNDDVELFDGFLTKLMATYDAVSEQTSPLHIIVGAVRDPASGNMTYSGMVRASRRHPLKFRKLPPDEAQPLECETMNGNCVLIPHAIVRQIGNLDSVYIQGGGDIDYGFKARKAGAKIWVAPGYAGTCEPNRKPFGLPFSIWFYFARQHGGWAWPIFVVSPYIKALMPKFSMTGRE